MPTRIFFCLLAFSLAGLGLVAFGPLVPVNGQTDLTPILSPKLTPPDPHWLALVHSKEATSVITPSLNLNLTDWYVAGRVMLGIPVTISVTRGTITHTCASTVPIPDGGGYFYLSYLWSLYPCGSVFGYQLQPDDVVWVAQASMVMSLTVPLLSALANSNADVVSGTAPLSATLTLNLFPFATPDQPHSQFINADGNGAYQVVLTPTVDVRPRDSGYVTYIAQPERQAYVRFVAPFLRVQANGFGISGQAAPNHTVELIIRNPLGVEVMAAYAYAGVDGTFVVEGDPWYRQPPVVMLPGYQVEAEAAGQTFSTTVLPLTALADQTTGQVTGTTLPDAAVTVLQLDGPLGPPPYPDNFWSLPPIGQALVTATSVGQYTATLLLNPADYGAATLTAPDGHQTYVHYAQPVIGVRLDVTDGPFYHSPLVWGQVNATSWPLTVAVQGPSGYLKDLLVLIPYRNGYFQDERYYQPDLTIDTGDVITISTDAGPQATLLIPTFTANANPVSNTVSGQAPPGAQLTITLYDAWAQGSGGGSGGLATYTLIVTATALGDYTADFSSLGGFSTEAEGEVRFTTDAGHTIARPFRATPPCQLRLDQTLVGSNFLAMRLSYGCPGGAFRLRAANGSLKYEYLFPYNLTYLYLSLYDSNGQPILIVPGDNIELESSALVTYTVPTLTVTPDRAANLITGFAPPGKTLTVSIYPTRGYATILTTTATAQGAYTLTLAGLYTLEAGDRIDVRLDEDEWPFYARAMVTRLWVQLYNSPISLSLSPLTPYTLTAGGASTFTGYVDSNGEASLFLDSALLPGDAVTLTTSIETVTMTLPALTAQVDLSTATISGQAPPNAPIEVELYANRYFYYFQAVTSTASGHYTATFSIPVPIQEAHGNVTHINPAGHRTSLEYTTARWQIMMDSACVGGNTMTSFLPITVTLNTGGALYEQNGYTQYLGEFDVCFPVIVQPGDMLTATTLVNTITHTVPNLTARHNYGAQTLTGQAPPNSLVTVTFYNSPYPYPNEYPTRQTQADATGYYGLDTSDLTLPIGISGYVLVTDADGNTAQKNFVVEGYRVYLPALQRGP